MKEPETIEAAVRNLVESISDCTCAPFWKAYDKPDPTCMYHDNKREVEAACNALLLILRIRERLECAERDNLVADFLITRERAFAAEEKVKALSHQLESDRTQVAECITKANNAIGGREWLEEGRGPYEWDDDRWHAEFAAAANEIKESLAPLTAMATNWKDCPMKGEEVAQARVDLQRQVKALRAEVAAKDARVAKLEAALLEIVACPEGKSKTWPEIDAIVNAALAPEPKESA